MCHLDVGITSHMLAQHQANTPGSAYGRSYAGTYMTECAWCAHPAVFRDVRSHSLSVETTKSAYDV